MFALKSIHIETVIFGARVLAALLCFLLLGLAACKKATNKNSPLPEAIASPAGPSGKHQVKFDSCALITNQEIEAVQGSPVQHTTATESSGRGFLASQCFYATADPVKVVNLDVTQGDPDSRAKGSGKDLWQKSFGQFENEKSEGEHDKEATEREGSKTEREKSLPPKRINGIGDDAFWVRTRFSGTLYVLKKDFFIRISLGGPENEEIRINKSKALAEKALRRL